MFRSTLTVVAGLLAALLLCIAAPVAHAGSPLTADDLAGTYTGDRVTLVLKREGDSYTGTLTVDGKDFPVAATANGPLLSGRFRAGDDSYDFAARLEERTLTLTSGGATHTLTRKGGNPLANPAPAAPNPLATPATPAPVPGGPEAEIRFQRIQTQSPSGGALLATPRRTEGATALLAAALPIMASMLDAPPAVAGAFADAKDDEVQAAFQGRTGGKPLRGVVYTRRGAADRPAVIAIAYDSPENLGQSLPALTQALQEAAPAVGGGAAAPKKQVQWQNVPLPDGSGQMRLPQGWTITGAHQGAVDANGPEGAVSFGSAFTVFTPEAAAQWYARPPLVAAYSTPSRALSEVFDQLAAAYGPLGQPTAHVARVIEEQPTDYPGGQAAFVDCEIDFTSQGNATRYRGLTLVIIAPVGDGSYMFYNSGVYAPVASFAASFPTLIEIWKGWRVSDATIKARLDKAAADMREISRITRETSENRSRAMENTNSAWSHVFREDWPIEDTQTGERADAQLRTLQPTIDALNKEAGYERYKEVPIQQLNPR